MDKPFQILNDLCSRIKQTCQINKYKHAYIVAVKSYAAVKKSGFTNEN